MTVVENVKANFNWIQAVLTVLIGLVPVGVALLVFGAQLERRQALSEYAAEEYLVPTLASHTLRIRELERVNGVRQEQVESLTKQLDRVVAELQQIGEEMRQLQRR